MNFTEAIKSAFSKYATFKGRSRRSEYWYFLLFSVLCSLVITGISAFAPTMGIVLNLCFSLGFILPSLAVQVRRLHDVGKTGKHVLYCYILVIVSMILLFAGLGFENLAHLENPSDKYMNIPLLMFGVGTYLIAFCYSLFIFVQMFRDSEYGENKYGLNPKGLNGSSSNF